MNKSFAGIILVAFLSLTIIGCNPPASRTTPATPLVSTPQPSNPNVATPSAENAAWQKVVETAKKEGKVTLYSYNFTGDTDLAISKAFQDRYGITVQTITGRGAEFLARLTTEKRTGQQTGDFTEGNAVIVKNMKLEGLTTEVASGLPSLKETAAFIIDPRSLDPKDGHLIAHFANYYSPWVNTRLVKRDEEPKVWRDLLKPRWKGKMSLTEFNVSVGPYVIFVPLLREKIIDEDFLKKLYTQDLHLALAGDDIRRLAKGDEDLTVRGSDVYSSFVMEGAPLRAVETEDGVVISPGAAAIIGGAPHPNAAKLFMNWIISPEGQTVFGKSKGIGLVRKDVPDFRPDNVKFVPKRPVVMTVEDNEQGTRLWREKWLQKLWGL